MACIGNTCQKGFQLPHKFYLWKIFKPRLSFTFFTTSTHLHRIRCQVRSPRRPSSGCSALSIDSLSIKKKKKKDCGQVSQGFRPNLTVQELKPAHSKRTDLTWWQLPIFVFNLTCFPRHFLKHMELAPHFFKFNFFSSVERYLVKCVLLLLFK